MRINIFTLRYSSSLGGFDEQALARFTRDKEILSFREYFFHVHDMPHLVCIVTWQAPKLEQHTGADRERVLARASNELENPAQGQLPIPSPKRDTPRPRAKRPDPAASLDEAGRTLFQTLRTWRAQVADKEGIPPYLIFTNKQLVELVQRRPASPSGLLAIHGIGPGKVKKYAQRVLDLLAPEEVAP